MRPSEVLRRSREAVFRMRAIDAEKVELRDRIGVQGHTYGRHAKNSILDPMRKVDDLVDITADLDMERMECQRDVSAAWSLMAGVRAMCPYEDAEYLLSRYYMYGESMDRLARSTPYSVSVIQRALKASVEWCDGQGIARLKGAVEYE